MAAISVTGVGIGGVRTPNNSQLQKQLNESISEVDALSSEVDALSSEVDALSSEVDALSSEVDVITPLDVVNISNSTTLNFDKIYICDTSNNNITAVLPNSQNNAGRSLTIKKISNDSNSVIVSGFNSQTIDGSVSVSIDSQWTSMTVFSNGQNWYII